MGEFKLKDKVVIKASNKSGIIIGIWQDEKSVIHYNVKYVDDVSNINTFWFEAEEVELTKETVDSAS